MIQINKLFKIISFYVSADNVKSKQPICFIEITRLEFYSYTVLF